MQLGRRLSTGVAEDPPAPAPPVESEDIASPDQRAVEIVAAAQRELGELAPER